MAALERPLPAVILAGSDRKPVPIMGAARSYQFVVGYKGAEVTIAGRPLVQVLRERMLASGCFSLVLVAGPRRIYEPIVPGAVIDTDGDLGHNLRRIFRSCRWAEFLCVMACDILPSVEEFKAMFAHWEAAALPDCWLPLVEVPADLGPSAWKPRYGIRPTPGAPAQLFLPGHLAVLRLKSVRRRFICKLSSMLYRLRNRDIDDRRRIVYGFIVGDLLGQDLMNLFHFRLPTLTWKVLTQGFRVYSRLRKKTLSLPDLETAMREVIMRPLRRRNARVSITPTRCYSFARDLDTVNEVSAAGGSYGGRTGSYVPHGE